MTVAYETLGTVAASSRPTEIAAGNDTKSAYTQLVASSGIAAKLLYVTARFDRNANNPEFLIDIATGAASSEVIVVPDIYHAAGPAAVSDHVVFYGPFLVDIATATRYAARVEASQSFQNIDIGVMIASERLPDLTSAANVAYGVTSGGAPKGVAVDCGATANTKGAWAQVTASASATAEHCWLCIGANENAGGLTDAEFLIDIGTGSAASEVVKIPDLHMGSDTSSDYLNPGVFGPFPANVFQSQRVAVRAQSTTNDATDRIFSVSMMFTTGTVVSAGGASGARNPLRGPI